MKKLFILAAAVIPFFLPVADATAEERSAAVQYRLETEVPSTSGKVRLWIPYPVSDSNQDITGIQISGNYTSRGVYREPVYGNNILYAEWIAPAGKIKIEYTFNVTRKEQSLKSADRISPVDQRKYTDLKRFGSAKSKILKLAETITKDSVSDEDKARAVYDWIVNNMQRDPQVKGCGFSEIDTLLETRSGKCADIHSVFTALLRSAGIPAREIFGIRIPGGAEGDMTRAQHCWTEFYINGKGWIPADPADVRKHILEKKLTIEQASDLREYYFGNVDDSRIAYGTGENIKLNPAQKGSALRYFMYSYAEADGKALGEDLFGFNLGYKISFKENAAGK